MYNTTHIALTPFAPDGKMTCGCVADDVNRMFFIGDYTGFTSSARHNQHESTTFSYYKKTFMQNFFFVGTAANAESVLETILSQLKSNFMATSKKAASDRFKNDAAFERSRENIAEFARANKAAKLLRTVFRQSLINVSDKKGNERLAKLTLKILQTDPQSDRGQRIINNGNISLLRGYNFNNRGRLSDVLYVRYQVTVNKETGQAIIDIPAFVPRVMLQAHPKATHFKLLATAAAVDFESEAYEYVQQYSTDIELNNLQTEAIRFVLTLPDNPHPNLLVTMGIEFYQQTNEKLYNLKSAEYSAIELVAAVK